jgi:hypothetical protein
MPTTTISIIPPEIKQLYDSTLLKRAAKLYDSTEDLWRMYYYIKHILSPRLADNPVEKAEYDKLEQQFLVLYEQARQKEAAMEKTPPAERKSAVGKFMYFIHLSDRSDEKIYCGLRRRSRSVLSASRQDYEVQPL